jgi:serine/threonine protein kinase
MNELTSQDLADSPQIEGFEILGIAGRGGMSVVYKARQVVMDRVVALKMLHKHSGADNMSIQRFINEARMTTSLHHPNLASVLSVGTTEKHQLFLVLEYLEGRSLKDVIAETDALPAEEVRELFIAILNGLQAAHDSGIIHRDLKPANIVLVTDKDGETIPKIVDFGIAKMFEMSGGEAQRLTQTGAIIGSPAYMSPEQCTGQELDVRADIYSIGCMMFEALTGRAVFDGDNVLELMTSHLHRDPTAPSMVSRCANGFDEIILKCLKKNPSERYQNCGEIINALQSATFSAPNVVLRKRKKSYKGVVLALCIAVLCFLSIFAAVHTMNGWNQQHAHLECQEKLALIPDLLKSKQLEKGYGLLATIDLRQLSQDDAADVVYAEYRIVDVARDEPDNPRTGWILETMEKLLRTQQNVSANAYYMREVVEFLESIDRGGADSLSFKHFQDNRIQILNAFLRDVESDKRIVNPSLFLAIGYSELGETYRLASRDVDSENAYRDAKTAARSSGLKGLEMQIQYSRERARLVPVVKWPNQ